MLNSATEHLYNMLGHHINNEDYMVDLPFYWGNIGKQKP